MPLSPNIRRLILAIVVLLTGFFCTVTFAGTWQSELETITHANIFTRILWYLVPVLIVLLIFHKPAELFRELCLEGNIVTGFGYAFLFTLPMLAGFAYIGNFVRAGTVPAIMIWDFKAGFTEEIFYRAFLFGQLYRVCKWHFVPAAAIPAVIFGVAHIYQGNDLVSGLAAFGITFAGAAWFSWLLKEWNYNLWLTIFLHFLMNFYWNIFDISEGAAGGLQANIVRGLTIAVSVFFTIRMMRQRKKKDPDFRRLVRPGIQTAE